jgi:hypothetical protein
MAEDFGVFRVTATISETIVGGSVRHRAVAHIRIIEPDGTTSKFEDRPIDGTFADKAEAEAAALKVGRARASELRERSRIEPMRDGD